jgi:hypothetical protein
MGLAVKKEWYHLRHGDCGSLAEVTNQRLLTAGSLAKYRIVDGVVYAVLRTETSIR